MSNHNTSSSQPSADMVSKYLPIVLNPDRTITRLYELPRTPASPDPSSSLLFLSKDVPLNPQHNTSVRILLPRQALDNSSPTKKKLPVIVYFHGGGFIFLHADSSIFHDFCVDLAVQARAMIVSVDYRLAPEHRLPAAYDDGVDALHWIRTSDDEWLRDFADLSNCFLMGSSAGGNIAYHAGLRAAAAVDDLAPLKIQGMVLHQPYFGGSDRTPSEMRLVDDPLLPLFLNDLMWELSLPIGADRDHEYCNLTVSSESESIEQFKLLGWKVIVTGCDGDPLIDRQMELVKILEKKGVQTIASFDEGGFHGVEFRDPTRMKAFLETLMPCLN
ncbi:Carboxylesterase [Actinidia chinensis var. chinensis]|uniref:Carboxylesterase n=1 Tax=Actinidia chinensis var. chinensis TaxID=1590841 RepID=A0A2R6RSX5_ACTCC|nr:Carboxylesterase [Actinidia chinensis var. chinensis]